MQITYFGHSAFQIGNLLIDPFISENPHTKTDPKNISCKIICVTHDHQDHIGDTFEIAKNTGATIVCIHEIAQLATSKGLKAEGMNLGGWLEIGDWKIKMVEAKHSCDLGHPAGFILKNTKHNQTIYHAGDTAFFSDMKLIREEKIDIAMLPIGGRYTMDITDASKAAKLINAEVTIPIHYNTFPVITADPLEFKNRLNANKIEIFKFDESREI